MLLPENADHHDLRNGHAPWRAGRPPALRAPLERDIRCDVLVVGAGITGALAAQHLAARGHDVCIVDRERPGYGSTAASTAMLLWEIDRPLTELSGLIGFERAAGVYRRSVRAVDGLVGLARSLGLGGIVRPRPSLYLAGAASGGGDVLEEHRLRARAGLPGVHLDHRALRDGFGFDRAGAILSPGSADADPLLLAHAMIAAAVASGARGFDACAVRYESAADGACVTLDNGCAIEARHVVLATGYVMPDFIEDSLHRISATWAIATPPQPPAGLWRDGALVWEMASSYAYLRTTADHRIIIGGEDDPALAEPDKRDAALPAKAAALRAALAALCPGADSRADFAWSGSFGETVDGLPLIGPVPGRPRLHAAYGYGGNGITYSFLAARLIARAIDHGAERWHEDYALDRCSI